MARKYDSRTTTFSPEGRLYQVEYAMEAINNASPTIGLLTREGVVIVADKAIVSKLLEQDKEREKIFQISDNIICSITGWTADANILINEARLIAQRYLYTFNEAEPVEQLTVRLCNIKQSYTQFGGLRPFGVSFLIAGWDENDGFQLYRTDPAGNYTGWKATAVGQNSHSALSMLRNQWHDDLTLGGGLEIALKILIKTVDMASPSAERLEIGTITLDNKGIPVHKLLSLEETDQLIRAVVVE